jgi:glyoxylase-like metal-dependent hydrolase (beta-lactamase superfamily II)/predicted ester cyclase
MCEPRMEGSDPAATARAYFDALAARDVEAAAAMWAPDGRDRLAGFGELAGPEGVRGYFSELFAAIPDWQFEVRDLVADGERVAVHWRAAGTFTGSAYQGIEPTGARFDFGGLDLLRIRDGRIVENDAYPDGLTFMRQLGLLPAAGSTAEQRLTRVFNTRTKVAKRTVADAERIAEGVWRLRGGVPIKDFNVYLIEHDGGVTVFDCGIKMMANAIAAAGAGLGGIERVVLGHAHPDHRGAAPSLGVPVFCHPADKADAEGDGGVHYFDYAALGIPGKWAYPPLLRTWDGGPVEIAGTVEEGDEVAGFRVVHVPGHAPGMIALHRESDRLALTTDTFYTLDPITTRKGPPRVPLDAFNHDTEQARASIRKLAALDLAAAWPGHADPVVGDVRGQLERAAAG